MFLDDFTLDLAAISQWTQKKRSLGAWSLYLPSSHIWQGLKDFLPLSKPKKGVCRRNNNSFGVQEGVVMTSGHYLPRGFCQGLHVLHKVQ
jgi:hypothetical protein